MTESGVFIDIEYEKCVKENTKDQTVCFVTPRVENTSIYCTLTRADGNQRDYGQRTECLTLQPAKVACYDTGEALVVGYRHVDCPKNDNLSDVGFFYEGIIVYWFFTFYPIYLLVMCG